MANTTSTEQIMKALSGLIPEDAQEKVSGAMSAFVEEAVAKLEAEYNAKLEEAYKQVADEKATDEKTAEEGYGQAWEIITDLRERLEVQKEEFEQALEEGYEEAYQMLQEERAKNDTLEIGLHEEYEKKHQEIKEYMIDKVDQFLSLQGEKYYEMAKRDVLNDPAVAEHKVAFDRILEVAANYLSDEDFAYATSSKIETLAKQVDDQKAVVRTLEAKNFRLATENQKLNEAVRQQGRVLTENVNTEKKARLEKVKQAEGRGQINQDRQVVIGEAKDESGEVVTEQKPASSGNLVETHSEVFADWRHLAGMTKEETPKK